MIETLTRGALNAAAFACTGAFIAAAPVAFAADATPGAATPAPATTAADSNDPATHDPMEGLNRAIFEVNGVFYEITTPLVEATPDPIRGLFKAVGTALSAPIKIVTNIATGDPSKEHLADIARQEDVDCGYFIVLPFAGPTTSRDAVGTAAEVAANPGTYIIVAGAGGAVDERIQSEAQIRQLDGALDKYALARSATLQERGCIVTREADAPRAFDEGDRPAEAAAK
jgi:ABC-type transporter lipoprotein component MlaA